MATQIKLRRDTAANWSSNSTVVLAAGEPGFETDTGKLKIGNGASTWAQLSYISGGTVSSLVNGSYTVSVGADGYLNLPNGLDTAGALIQSTSPIRVNSNSHFWTFGSDGYLTGESLNLTGFLKGVDGSTGSTGQVLTRQSNGGVAWAPGGGAGFTTYEEDSTNYNTIGVGNQLNYGDKVWVNADGAIGMLGGTTVRMIADDIGGSAWITTGDASLYSGIPGPTSGGYNWQFGGNGITTFPGALTGVETSTIWTSNITGITTGSTTRVTIHDNQFGGPDIGQIIILGVTGATEANGTWWYQATDSNEFQLYTDYTATTPVDSSSWGSYASGGTAAAQSSSGLSINANGKLWGFKPDGTLTAPGNIVVGGASGSQEQHFVIDASNYWTSIQWKNMADLQDPSNLPFECQAQLLRVFADNNTVTNYCNVSNPRIELVAVTAVRPTATTHNGLMISTSDVKIPDAPYNDGTGTRHDWIFGGDGGLVFPDGTTQTTAYVNDLNPLLWAVKATSQTKSSITQAVAYDSAGNSFTLMWQGPFSGGGEYKSTIVKLNSTGGVVWAVDLANGDSVNPWSLVCDSSNNVYAVVQRYVTNVYNNVLVKLNGSTGAILWQVDIQDSQNANNMQVVPFVYGPVNGVVVAGTAYNSGNSDFFIAFVNQDGTTSAPAMTYGSAYDEEAYSLAVNNTTGDLLMVGVEQASGDNYYHLEMIKFNVLSGIVWQKKVSVTGDSNNVQATDCCLLADGNWAILATHNGGIVTMKVDNTTGAVMWSREIAGGCTAVSSSVTTDPNTGHIFITASTIGGTGTNNNPIVTKLVGAYDTDGNALWQKYVRVPDNNALLDPNWWNELGSQGRQLAVHSNSLLLAATLIPATSNSSPIDQLGCVLQLTLLGEDETIGMFETRNSYLTDTTISLTVEDTTFDITTNSLTLTTGSTVTASAGSLTYVRYNAGSRVSQLANGGQAVTLDTTGSLVNQAGRNILGELDRNTDSGNNFSNMAIGIKNASGYKRLVGLTNTAQVWISLTDVATQIGINQYSITGMVIDYQAQSSSLNYNGSMVGQIIIASNENYAMNVSHMESAITQSNSQNDIVFANLDLWNVSGGDLRAIRTDSYSQQLDIIWTAKVFYNNSENWC